MSEFKVTFKTLTPLWTGDARGECDELKLTGLIGSLRWWFEALVRGMGYKACDSTGDKKCQIEIRNPDDVLNIHKKICPVCYLFGTTGWKGRFSVSIENDSNLSKPYNNGKVVVNIDGGRGWHYESGLMGQATLTFQYEDMIIGKIEEKGDKKTLTMKEVFPSILKILFYLISEYGMLGAKTSMGYGVIKVVQFKIDGKDMSVSVLKGDWKNFENYLKLFNSEFQENINYLPNLKDFFFVKFDVIDSIDNVINNVKIFFSYQGGIIETDAIDKWKSENWCITSPVIRKEIRKKIKDKFSGNNKLRHFLMGKVAGNKTKFSAIQVSHVYKKSEDSLEFRIYGWLPDIGSISGKAEDIIQLLQQLFQDLPWKDRYNANQSRQVDLLPSEIQLGVCWDLSKGNLSLVEDKIKELFNISGGSEV